LLEKAAFPQLYTHSRCLFASEYKREWAKALRERDVGVRNPQQLRN